MTNREHYSCTGMERPSIMTPEAAEAFQRACDKTASCDNCRFRASDACEVDWLNAPFGQSLVDPEFT